MAQIPEDERPVTRGPFTGTTDLPLVAMTPADDFGLYEHFAAKWMKPDDFYSGAELQAFLIDGSKSAWWVKDKDGGVVAWCALTHSDKDWDENACSFLGLAVNERYRRSALALRLIRHVLKEGGRRPMMTYIQPGAQSERLTGPLGFKRVGVKDIWNVYRREPVLFP